MDAVRGGSAPSPELGYYQLRQAVLQTLRSVGLRASGSMSREAMTAVIEKLRIAPGDVVFVDTECPDFLSYLLSGLAGEVTVALASPLDASLSQADLLRLQDSIGHKAAAIVGANRFASPERIAEAVSSGTFKQLRHGFGGRLRQGLSGGNLTLPPSALQFLNDPLWKAACGTAPSATDTPASNGEGENPAAADEPAEKKRGRGRPRKYPLPTAAIWWTSIPAADRTTMAFWESNPQVYGAIGLPEQDRSALFLLSPDPTTAVEMGQLSPAASSGADAATPALVSRRVGFGEIFANGERYCPEWYLGTEHTCGEALLGEIATRIGRGTTLSGKSLPLEGPLHTCTRILARAAEQPGITIPPWLPRTGTFIEWGNLLEPTDIAYVEASGIRENGTIELQLLTELPPQQGRYIITPEDGPVILIPRDGSTCALVEAPCTILLANSIFAVRFPRPGEDDEAAKPKRGRKPKATTGPIALENGACAAPSPAFVEIFLQSSFGRHLLDQLPKPLGKNELAALPIPLLSEEMQQEVIDRNRRINQSVLREAERAEKLITLMNETAHQNRFED